MTRRALLPGLAALAMLALAGCGKKGKLESPPPKKKKDAEE